MFHKQSMALENLIDSVFWTIHKRRAGKYVQRAEPRVCDVELILIINQFGRAISMAFHLSLMHFVLKIKRGVAYGKFYKWDGGIT